MIQNTKTVLKSALNSAESDTKRFSILVLFFRFFLKYFQRYAFLDIWPVIKKFKPGNWKSLCVTLCRIQCRFQNCLCFSSSIDSFQLLFFWRFKNTFYWRGKYICMHIILSIIRVFWSYKCILSRNRVFLYDISAFMFYFICYFFSMNLVFFYEIF